MAVSIEGCSTAEGGSQTSGTELVVDTAEYYGHEDFLLAERVEYVQLKHSTIRTEDEWTIAGLAKTVSQFIILFQQRCADFGPEAAAAKLRFAFVTNRPIHSEVMQALAAAQQDEGETDEETISTLARWNAKSGLNAAKFKCFLRLLRLQGRESNRAVQDDELRGGLATLSPRSTDEELRDQLVEFVRRNTLTNAAHDPVIRQAALLKCLGVAMPEDLFPAPPRFEEIPAPLPTQQEEQVAECVRRANAPVLVHATSGVGKSVLARRLPALMPPGSVAVVFDGFAGGDYRKPSQPRHLHEMGLVQIANELAENGLCEPLLPLKASPHQYLRAFRRRLEQAAITLRQRHADALVLVVLDAADNSEDAAVARNEGPSFVRNLVQETPPLGCRLVLMARTERRNRFPDRVPETIEIPLEPFSQAETAAHLRRSFSEADAGSVVEFHRYTGGNPRIQSYLLARAGLLPELLWRLGPGRLSIDDQIEFEVEDALRRTREHFGEAAGIDALCGALAALPPRVPTRILAKATNVEVAAIDSFVADLGRPLLHLDGYVQFRDEPAETWFRRRFAGDEASFDRVVKSLRSLADKDAYVAAAWPGLLFQAGLHDELFTDVLGAEPNIEDVLERRAIVRERLRFGLKVAWKKGDRVTAARLLLRLGEAAATEEHQRDLLLKNDDLISALWSPEQVRETVFRKRAGGWYGVAHARYAAMLAPAPEHLAEARQSLRLAEEWLDEWAEFPSDEPNRDGPDEEDAAAFARAWLFLKGPEQCVDWIARWRPEVFRFRVAHRLAESLLDRGDNFQALALVESARYQDARIALGTLLALTEAGQMPSAESVADVVAAWSEIQPPDSEGYDFSSNKVTEEQGVVVLAEAMARVGLNHQAILAHIERHLPKIPNHARTESYYFRNGRRDSHLCAYALRAVLKGEQFDPIILLPDRLKRDGNPLPNDLEVGEFKQVYGLLAPWYQLRAESLLGLHNIAEVKRLARTLAISGNSHFMSWQWRQDGPYWANYVAGLWWDVLLIANAANMEEVDAIVVPLIIIPILSMN
ncbi:MAG: hypothetical protein P9F19_04225 [Candidatus Contendobacter sp.]|nr:hypothetical protein [Candidatus Contendobacter sp.]MDG4556592.1 hypothetical protein [Candidatus Contendobacter sp.]